MGNTGLSAGSLLKREYAPFRGVDYTNYEVSLYRSPDSKNMWKNYKSLGKGIESRPDILQFLQLTNTIYGMYFYTVTNVKHLIIHCGVSLIDYNMETKVQTTIKATGMNPARSQFFIFQNLLYIKDGLNYLVYDGSTVSNVVGYIPTTTISRAPNGGGTPFEGVNMLSIYRKNSFCADGTSTVFNCDVETFDSSTVRVWINDVEQISGFTADSSSGKVTFTTPPPAPLTDGQDNVIIQFQKETVGHANRILKCTLLAVFDSMIFVSGNQDYPNVLFVCGYNLNEQSVDPTYFPDRAPEYVMTEGLDLSPIKAMIPGNNALWVFKEPSQANTTVFYHTPSPVYDNGILINQYPQSHSSITTGCKTTGINFNDDIVFFSDRGMEAVTGDVTTEQVLSHRSTLVDPKLTLEENYKNMILQEWEGYLLVIIDNHIYLADSRCLFTNQNHNEYEWFYWEFSTNINVAIVDEGILYLASTAVNGVSKIYTLTKSNTTINAYWTTCEDECGFSQMQKVTNKRGCVIDMTGDELKVEVRTDNNNFKTIDTYNNTKGYIVPRIKQKKWKDIQFKFSSDKPFGLEKACLEVYVGNYVKR